MPFGALKRRVFRLFVLRQPQVEIRPMPFGALKQADPRRHPGAGRKRQVEIRPMPFGRVGGVRTYYALTAKKRNESFDSLRFEARLSAL
jgi:hypothetical protein